MIRAKVEKQVGLLSNEVWDDTCKIADSTLITRKNYRLKNDLQYVLILCIGIADAIIKGYIRKGIA
jgi:hypothetical protein